MIDEPAPLSGEDFEVERMARYRRLSLLTLDLAEEAGESAVHFSKVDRGEKANRFDRRIATMTRAIWAHQAVERLRLGRERVSAPRENGGRVKPAEECVQAPTMPAPCLADGATIRRKECAPGAAFDFQYNNEFPLAGDDVVFASADEGETLSVALSKALAGKDGGADALRTVITEDEDRIAARAPP